MAGSNIWIPYCGPAPAPSEWLGRWNGDPWLIGALLLALLAARRSAAPRYAFAAVGLAAILFVSPFCALTSALFAARTAHHLLLVAAVAPLIAWSAPLRCRHAWTWGTASTAVMWLWHVPSFYAAALSNDAIYWAMQLSLAATATAFWSAVRHAPAPTAVAALLGYMVPMGLLGALLTFSAGALYAPHALTTLAWGLSPLADQQLAGLIMWVPGSAVYLGAALLLMRRLLVEPMRALAS